VSTLGASAKIHRVELNLPQYGTAWARVETVAAIVPAGAATLVLGDLSLVGTVLAPQAGENAPSTWVGVWVSGAGWDVPLPPRKAYQSDAGVRLKTILADLAKDAGNLPIVLPSDASVGPFWCRSRLGADKRARTMRDELFALQRGGFLTALPYVDPLGVTRFGGRTSGPVTATARVLRRDLDQWRRVIGVDSPAAFVPGATFEGVTIGRVVIRENAGAIELETWTR
jgi:hypothetical protein